MKKIFLACAIAATALTINACGNHTTSTPPATTTTPSGNAANQDYICPMDKDITSDKPGVCSKCGMDLVKKEKNADQNSH